MGETGRERRHYFRLRGNAIEIFGRPLHLPATRLARVGLGVAFVIGGLLSFLPVLGVWMLPVGLLILSIDFVLVRRWRRRFSVHWERRSRSREEAARQARQAKDPRDGETRIRPPAR